MYLPGTLQGRERDSTDAIFIGQNQKKASRRQEEYFLTSTDVECDGAILQSLQRFHRDHSRTVGHDHLTETRQTMLNHRKRAVIAASAIAWSCAIAQQAEARVTRFVVEQRGPYLGGASWGNAGPYELLRGTATMEVDPTDLRDSSIVDLANAPRNSRNNVEFSTQFAIAKPVDMARSNHKIFHAINNRGNNLEGLLTATTPAQVAATTAGYAMSQGYVVVDAGWEGDVVPTPTRLVATLPRATLPNGDPITGPMRYQYYDRANGSFTTNLEGTAGFLSYETNDTNTASATFTVASSASGPKTPIPASRWAFGSCPTGPASLVPSTTDLCYFDGFDNSKVYEIIYQAKNPIVMALGFATTRDVASFLRYAAADDTGAANPLGGGITRAYAAGGSQTGGYLRDYVYLGFNEDESGRKVFDGVIPWIAGTDRVHLNVRFADPNTYSEQDRQHDYLQTSYPPFTYAIATDPISGFRDGILKRPGTDPVVMQIDSQTEFWQLHGSLNVADGLGNAVPIPSNARLYYVGNTAHGFANSSFLTPATGTNVNCSNATPGTGLTWFTLRAALRNMDDWVDRGIAPPASNYPSLLDGTLVPLGVAATAFPAIPGKGFPTVVDTYEQLDFGPQFTNIGGIITNQPPISGASYAIYVPKSDGDGTDLAGVHQIESRVPIATVTGWNIRGPAHRGPDLCSLSGSVFPFAATAAQRAATGDPRPSLQERYVDHMTFVGIAKRAAADLVSERFLLPEDAAQAAIGAYLSNVLK